ncbi:hypothetical protein D3C77_508270 [compost metagenome]
MVSVVNSGISRFAEQVQENIKLRNEQVMHWEKRLRGEEVVRWDHTLNEMNESKEVTYLPLDEGQTFGDVLVETKAKTTNMKPSNEQFNTSMKTKTNTEIGTQTLEQASTQNKSVARKDAIQKHTSSSTSPLTALNTMYALYGGNPYFTGAIDFGKEELNTRLGMLSNTNRLFGYGAYTGYNPYYSVSPTWDKLY